MIGGTRTARLATCALGLDVLARSARMRTERERVDPLASSRPEIQLEVAVFHGMAFPRSFKRETWYLRLPSGEIEVVTATALQRAFACGLVDYRTPVRAFGTHAWTTMLEAAQLETPVSLAMTSVSPMALDVPAADLADGLRWSRSEVDPKAFKPSRTAPALAALLASCVLVAVSLLGGEVTALVANASLQQEVTVMPVAPAPRKVARPAARMLELLRATKVVEARLTPDQKRRLLDLDCATRAQRPKSSFVKLLLPKPGASEDPFARKGSSVARRGDPLDGSL